MLLLAGFSCSFMLSCRVCVALVWCGRQGRRRGHLKERKSFAGNRIRYFGGYALCVCECKRFYFFACIYNEWFISWVFHSHFFPSFLSALSSSPLPVASCSFPTSFGHPTASKKEVPHSHGVHSFEMKWFYFSDYWKYLEVLSITCGFLLVLTYSTILLFWVYMLMCEHDTVNACISFWCFLLGVCEIWWAFPRLWLTWCTSLRFVECVECHCWVLNEEKDLSQLSKITLNNLWCSLPAGNGSGSHHHQCHVSSHLCLLWGTIHFSHTFSHSFSHSFHANHRSITFCMSLITSSWEPCWYREERKRREWRERAEKRECVGENVERRKWSKADILGEVFVSVAFAIVLFLTWRSSSEKQNAFSSTSQYVSGFFLLPFSHKCGKMNAFISSLLFMQQKFLSISPHLFQPLSLVGRNHISCFPSSPFPRLLWALQCRRSVP